jgi:hypothetical protein
MGREEQAAYGSLSIEAEASRELFHPLKGEE